MEDWSPDRRSQFFCYDPSRSRNFSTFTKRFCQAERGFLSNKRRRWCPDSTAWCCRVVHHDLRAFPKSRIGGNLIAVRDFAFFFLVNPKREGQPWTTNLALVVVVCCSVARFFYTCRTSFSSMSISET
jgi:hypothetical protein